ncbi:MAG: MoaD/ThiS family protein, partial [Candidatus Binatia bacterium]
FGIARLLTKTAKVSLTLPAHATLTNLLSALAQRFPVLAGQVINPETNTLAAGHACNINGRTFVRDPGTRINPGDSIFLLSADAGG